MRVLPVAGHGDKIKGNFPGNAARKVRQEKHATLQDAYEVEPFTWEVLANFFRQRVDPSLDPACSDQHADALFFSLPDFLLRRPCLCHSFSPLRNRDSTPRMPARQSSTCHADVAKYSSACKIRWICFAKGVQECRIGGACLEELDPGRLAFPQTLALSSPHSCDKR